MIIMKYCVDKIENEIALLESIDDKSKLEVNVNVLPLNVKENDIVISDGNKYLYDEKETKLRIKRIREKMERLRSDK